MSSAVMRSQLLLVQATSGTDAPDQAASSQPEAAPEASLENTTARALLLAPGPAVMAPAPAADKARTLGTPSQAPPRELAVASALPAAASTSGYPRNAQNVASGLAANQVLNLCLHYMPQDTLRTVMRAQIRLQHDPCSEDYTQHSSHANRYYSYSSCNPGTSWSHLRLTQSRGQSITAQSHLTHSYYLYFLDASAQLSELALRTGLLFSAVAPGRR
jgi:hypothetical protein